ncbi:helix-turn-helix transcriptional regulator [Edaphobacter sp. 4G125]|nr:helix-turn-helix transcriptional regulator [Edaphobacter sp. 4G125]
MLSALLEGRAFSAGELAKAANISAQSASMHLAQLLHGNLVSVDAQGRHRYYRIASPEVAHAMEALGCIALAPNQKPARNHDPIRYARTCYDHLAGFLAVKLTGVLEEKKWLTRTQENDFEVTSAGEEFFESWKINVQQLRTGRRVLVRRCLDWTERRDHVAGALGEAICQRLLSSRWIVQEGSSRAVRLTALGVRNLEPLFLQNGSEETILRVGNRSSDRR